MAVTICSDLETKKIKSVTVSIFPSSLCHEMVGSNVMIFGFWKCWVLSQLFHSSLSPSSGCSLVPLYFLPWGWCHLCVRGYWYFSQQSWFQVVLHLAQHFSWCTLRACVLSHFRHVRVYATLWTVAHHDLLSMDFFRQKCRSGLTCPTLGDFPDLGIKPTSLKSPSFADWFLAISTT